MKRLSSYIARDDVAKSIAELCEAEICEHRLNLPNYGDMDWPAEEKAKVMDVLIRESVNISTSTEQYPYFFERVQSLIFSAFPAGAFSSDNRRHDYALCSSVCLRGLVDAGFDLKCDGLDCFFFKL